VRHLGKSWRRIVYHDGGRDTAGGVTPAAQNLKFTPIRAMLALMLALVFMMFGFGDSDRLVADVVDTSPKDT
jgi:hypothetical protein